MPRNIAKRLHGLGDRLPRFTETPTPFIASNFVRKPRRQFKSFGQPDIVDHDISRTIKNVTGSRGDTQRHEAEDQDKNRVSWVIFSVVRNIEIQARKYTCDSQGQKGDQNRDKQSWFKKR